MGLFGFAKKDRRTYYLENIAEAKKKSSSRKFMKPSDTEIGNLKPNDVVRLFFVFNFKTNDGCRAERMWVEIIEKNGTNFKGRLTNRPVYIKDLSAGDIVEFTNDNIATILVKSRFDEKKKALVSRRAIEKSEINWAMKDDPDNDMDSGWRLFFGNEDDNYNSDVSNIVILSLENVLSFEPHLEDVFASTHNAFEWSEKGMRFVEVHE